MKNGELVDHYEISNNIRYISLQRKLFRYHLWELSMSSTTGVFIMVGSM